MPQTRINGMPPTEAGRATIPAEPEMCRILSQSSWADGAVRAIMSFFGQRRRSRELALLLITLFRAMIAQLPWRQPVEQILHLKSGDAS
jgi:hypothetical protein